KLVSVFAGLLGAVSVLVFNRYLAILSEPATLRMGESSPYDRLRFTLQAGGLIKQIVFRGMSNFLAAVDQFFYDADKRETTLGSRLFRLKHPAPLWTASAFDRCLLIAAIYPLTSLIVFWALTGVSSQAQGVVKLPGNLDPWQLKLQFISLGVEFLAI